MAPPVHPALAGARRPQCLPSVDSPGSGVTSLVGPATDFEGLWIRKHLRSEGRGFLLTGAFTPDTQPPNPRCPGDLGAEAGIETDRTFRTHGAW